MPNKLSKNKVRVSYAEDAEVRQQLERLAKTRGQKLTDLLKEATNEYVQRHKSRPQK
ncbi:MAG: hypothetical protein LBV12_00555 [Puniceicoccales bacterium]|jgi:hypothetical protein|nr:hypothetical protein [Puniceicoccales bacterium]